MLNNLLLLAVLFGLFWVLLPFIRNQLYHTAGSVSEGLERQGLSVSPRKIIQWMLGGSATAGLLFGIMMNSLLAAMAGIVLVYLVPGWILALVQARRRRRFHQQFIDVLLLMANSMRAGFNLSQGLQIVANEMPSPARDEFRLIVRQRELGSSLDEALTGLACRMRGESVTIFTTAILVTLQTGGDLTRVLDKLVKTIRDRDRTENRIRTMTSEGRGQGYTIAALPFVMLAGQYLFKPESVIDMFHSTGGLIIIIMGFVFNVLGLTMIQKMASVKV